MTKLNALIIHPDPQVRHQMRDLARQADFIRVLGEAVSAFEALELLEAVPYGVFFLGVDLAATSGVELPEATGFELAQMLSGRKHKPALVFIGDDEGAAFKALEMGATDYLLWPPSCERLARTWERLKQFKAHFKEIPIPDQWREADSRPEPGEERTVQLPLGEEEEEHFLAALSNAWQQSRSARPVEIEKLAITMDGRTILVPYDKVIFIEAYEDYSYVHTAGQKFLTSYRLKNLEDRLRHHRFFRVHRKYLVNLDMVTEIASLPGSNFMLRTAGKTRIELPVSRRRINELKQILGL